jgi:hypothetical protein
VSPGFHNLYNLLRLLVFLSTILEQIADGESRNKILTLLKKGHFMFTLTDFIPRAKLEAFCLKNHITKMSLFGSALRDELTPDSDIDILVEFDKNHIPGLLDLAGMEIELKEMLGRKVDLRTPAELSRYFRDDVLGKARVQYAI